MKQIKDNQIDNLAINTLKVNGVAAVNKANSGHPGIVLGAAKIIHTLFTRHMIFDPENPTFINRDRFILSAGHGSALLYSLLRLLNQISKEDLESFRSYKSLTPGHPEYKHTSGVDATTGPLGQGIAMAVGLATAEESLRARFPEVGHYTFALCGDGCLQEGVAFEAMSFAGRQQLKKLIVLHDSNDIQLDTPVNKVFNEDLKKRMEALRWNYIKVENDVEAIDEAITKAKASDKPTFIEIKTIIGEGATKQGTPHVHGAPLGSDFEIVKKYLNWTYGDFEVPKEVTKLYKDTVFARGAKSFKAFKKSKQLEAFLNDSQKVKIDLEIASNQATRASSGKVIEYLNKNVIQWIGGSADLAGSTKASGGDGDFAPENRLGRNILFGVREFAMAAIGNGIALHSNFKPFVSTFFVFSDYAKAAIRLSALMKLPITYVFTHDSVFVGEDGPTHEPIEQIAMLRSIPDITFIRPADEKEVIGAYERALNEEGPTIIALTRQNIISLDETSSTKIQKGLYQLVKNESPWTLVASGSELASAVILAKEFKINAVSISNSKGKIAWDIQKAITIEAGSTYGLSRWGKFNLGIDSFGVSAPGEIAYKHFKLDINNLRKQIDDIIKSN